MTDRSRSDTDAYSESRSRHDEPALEELEQLDADPDLFDDLGYELLDLEGYETEEGGILFLPRDEDMLRDDAFIVARKEDVCLPEA